MNELLRRMLEGRGIMIPASEHGSDEGMPGGDNDDNQSQDTGSDDDANGADNENKGSDDEKGSDEKGQDDKKLDPEVAKLIKDVMKWKDKARSTESEKSELSQQLSQFKTVLGEDVSLDDVKELIQGKKDSERKELEAKGEYERILEQMKDENKKVVEGLKTAHQETVDENKSLKAQIEELTVGRSFSDSEFIRKSSVLPPPIARKEFADHFDVVEGELVGYDKPRGAADRTPLVDANGDKKGFEQAIESLYAKHPNSKDITRSARKPGAGSKSQPDAKKATPPAKTSADKIAAGLEKLSNAS